MRRATLHLTSFAPFFSQVSLNQYGRNVVVKKSLETPGLDTCNVYH